MFWNDHTTEWLVSISCERALGKSCKFPEYYGSRIPDYLIWYYRPKQSGIHCKGLVLGLS